MNDWEELELAHDEEMDPGSAGAPLLPWLVGSIFAVSLLLGLGYYVTREDEPRAQEPSLASTPSSFELEPAAPPEEPELEPELEEPAVELPPLSASDVFVRDMASRLSAHPEIASVLLTDDLVRRFVVSVVNIAEAKSPQRQMHHVRPEGDFEVIRRGGRVFLDPRSYERYDLHAEILASLDAEGLAELYRASEPLIEEAFAELGFPETERFDAALARAISVLLETPLVEGPIELEAVSVNYTYADPRLERLAPAQKHLLRMGPENAKRVQAKLEEIARALEVAVSSQS